MLCNIMHKYNRSIRYDDRLYLVQENAYYFKKKKICIYINYLNNNIVHIN